MIRCRCGCCCRTVHFIAADLVTVLGPHKLALEAPFPCSRCKTTEWIRVDSFAPALGDYGDLRVRRPGPVKAIQTWRTERLGDVVLPYVPGADPYQIE